MTGLSTRLVVAVVAVSVAAGSTASVGANEAASPRSVLPSWVRVTSGPQPGPGPMTYDRKRQEVVLFRATSPSQTWVFNGTSRRWMQRFPSTDPAVFGGQIGYDAQTGDDVLIASGESTDNCIDLLSAQTWTWDGTNWTQQHPITAPGECQALGGTSLVYEGRRHRLLLNSAVGFATSTWAWDGATWTEVAGGPENAGIAYDPALSHPVAYGGYDDEPVPEVYGATSTWNGTQWVPLLRGGGAHQPLPRGYAAMTYDGALHALIMFGGLTVDINGVEFVDLHDTWSFVPNHWTRLYTKGLPPPMAGAAFVYDSAHHFALLLGNGTWLLT